MPLPLILAGPILRRVEPNFVSVWVALSEAASVMLTLWEGRATPSSVEMISGPRPAAQTLRIGDKLHIVVAALKIDPGSSKTLLPGRIYSYDLTIETRESGKTENLRTCNLLKDEPINGHPHLALGYEPDLLPSFALTPSELTDLRIVHGSCRRASALLTDGLAWVDDLILDARKDLSSFALKRPHQLLMTGDQIYADDLRSPQLHIVTELGQTLFGDKLVEQIKVGGQMWPVDLTHFPPGLRLTLVYDEARMTSTDGDNHLFSFAEFCAMYLLSWSSACWPAEMPTEDLFPDPLELLKKIPEPLRGKVASEEDLKKFQKDPGQKNKDRKKAFEQGLTALKNVLKTMPKVRRALANVPTYMMFDDHDVTDDWYLNPTWRDRVLTSPLGKTIIRNGLLSYALFQGWGNDPVKFETGDYAKLLDHATRLIPAPPATGPAEFFGGLIDTLLGLDLTSGLEESNPPLKWHYSIHGAKHMVLALDNRTRRSFITRDGPIGNVSISAQQDQIPLGPLPGGIEVLLVLAPLQVIGPPVLDDLIGPASYKAFDLIHNSDLQKHSGSKDMTGTNPDAIEAWAYDVKTFEALLKRLEPYRRVVFLSGDVHYGTGNEMSYWKKGDTEPARFVQFTSSGIQNVMPWYILFADRSVAFGQRMIRADIGADRLGWNDNSPDPLVIPAGAKLEPAVQSKRRQSPMMISVEDCPRGTTLNPQHLPDWSWHVKPGRDIRADAERPEQAQPESVGDADVTANLDGYRRVVKRHVAQLEKLNNSRQILFSNNIGVVTFQKRTEVISGKPEEIIEAVQSLYTTHPKAEDPDKAEAYTVYVIPLRKPNEARPEARLKA